MRSIGTALKRIVNCGLIVLFMMSAMPNTAVAETPGDITYEWMDFLSLLSVEEQIIWDSPEFFQFWLTEGVDPDTASWGGLSLEEITELLYPPIYPAYEDDEVLQMIDNIIHGEAEEEYPAYEDDEVLQMIDNIIHGDG